MSIVYNLFHLLYGEVISICSGAKLIKRCINSWKKYCPDYQLIEWNESNYDLQKNVYMYEAYCSKKWAFVSDVARLDIIYQHGGIYFDTDVEVIKSFDDLLSEKAFMGFQDKNNEVATGLGFGAEKNNPIILDILTNCYFNKHFKRDDNTLDTTPTPSLITRYLSSLGLKADGTKQNINGLATIYPTDFFCPKSFVTGRLSITDNTFSIHHFMGSWTSTRAKIRNQVKWRLYSLGVTGIIIFKVSYYFLGVIRALRKAIRSLFKSLKTMLSPR